MAPKRVTSADGTSIAYEQSGDGPPLIVTGGALQDRRSALPLAEQLAPHFRVVRYDRRGRGDSGDTWPYDVAREVEDLQALVRKIGGAPSVFGMSSGGVLALRAAAAGVPASRLALYEPPFVPDETAARRQAQRTAVSLKTLLAEGRRADAVTEFLTTVGGVPPQAVARIRDSPVFFALEGLAATLAYDLDVLGDGTIPAEVTGSVTVPVRVLYGGASPAPVKRVARRLAKLLPAGQSAELPGQAHSVAPSALAAVLLAFFSGTGEGTQP